MNDADYIRHFMSGLGAVPEWAPQDEDHLLRSTSIITDVKYQKRGLLYTAFDPNGTEVIRLSFSPKRILADGDLLGRRDNLNQPGWQAEPGGVIRIRRDGANKIEILSE
jgi:hypothetical protein